MTSVATKLGVGTAACAVAVAASVMSVQAAEAAPVAAPAAPVILGPANVSQNFGLFGFTDLLKITPSNSTPWHFTPSNFHPFGGFLFRCYPSH